MLGSLLTYLSIFTAIFSTVALGRLIINFISALTSNPPRKLELSERALIIYGLFFSYFITFLIYIL